MQRLSEEMEELKTRLSEQPQVTVHSEALLRSSLRSSLQQMEQQLNAALLEGRKEAQAQFKELRAELLELLNSSGSPREAGGRAEMAFNEGVSTFACVASRGVALLKWSWLDVLGASRAPRDQADLRGGAEIRGELAGATPELLLPFF